MKTIEPKPFGEPFTDEDLTVLYSLLGQHMNELPDGHPEKTQTAELFVSVLMEQAARKQ